MRIFITIFFLSMATITLSGCETVAYGNFTTENIMQVHQGMSSDKVIALFGMPQDVGVAVCGKHPNTWSCTNWKYGAYGQARFRFSGEPGSLVLNDFNIDRDSIW